MKKSSETNQTKKQSGMSAPRTPSTESAASVADQTTGKYTTTNGKTAEAANDSQMIISYGVNVHNTIAVVMVCTQHNTMALKQITSSKVGLWLPWAPVMKGQTWAESLKEMMDLFANQLKSFNALIVNSKSLDLIHASIVEIPQQNDTVKRFTFKVEVKHESESNKCFDNSNDFQWISCQEMSKISELWGAEPSLLAAILTDPTITIYKFQEITVREVMKYSPKDKESTTQEVLVKAAGFSEKYINKLFGQYLQQCAPSTMMGEKAFIDYMAKLALPGKSETAYTLNMNSLFRSMARSKQYIVFKDLLLGLCALDTNVPHSGHTAILRTEHIYAYYASDWSKGLSRQEMKQMCTDIRLANNNIDNKGLDEEVKQLYQIIANKSKYFKEKDFIQSVGSKKIRGTAILFRSSISPIQALRNKQVYDSLALKMTTPNTQQQQQEQQVVGTCLRCRLKKYTLAVHTVRLSSSGFITEPQENKNQTDIKRMDKTLKRMSNSCFTAITEANIIIDSIRTFGQYKFNINRTDGQNSGQSASGAKTKVSGSADSDIDWGNPSGRTKVLKRLYKLCELAQAVFQKESRVIRVSSPVFVLGDIHGNLHDLMIYERSLWKMGPTCVASSFLFLGDYVDRGEYSIECITYLLCHKVLCPEKYYMLRGNHELRSVNQSFTFRAECINKFGQTEGPKLWEALNTVFDYMPICAIIDESIYCAHGGIPTDALRIQELNSIPMPLSEPENQCQTAWQILWNDPVTNQEFRDFQELLRTQQGSSEPKDGNLGFLPNKKRGTAYYYSDVSLNRFFAANQLSHVIRAHEVIPNGYAFHMGGKCITVFSSSKYCNGLNEAAVILVNDEKIRVIKIDTN
ncbi:uncharacterized protein LOC128957696 [Oppia nitens]|uniref:uncharacterized protein LOC128957696 n=1 Tax=Oppia nitens TaxID=1686743 RepID=UPI0023DAD0BE|nr:uncharacterized protein LOC128957696 [Oppia nitens]